MAVTLIINPGSSSKKYALFAEDQCLGTWRFERNEQTYEICTEYQGQRQKCEGITSVNYQGSFHQVLNAAKRDHLIEDFSAITHVAVRIVAPGTRFQSHTIIDTEFLHTLRHQEATAPLHIPHTVKELRLVMTTLPAAVVVGVSDSAFHKELPTVARTYSITKEDASRYDIYRFGYHGISCASVWRRLPSFQSATPKRCIIAHIGSGMSMTALKNGQSIDTTMGYSPASGLIMGSRAGDVGSGALLELMRVRNFSPTDLQSYLQTQSGLKGLTGDADFRHILERLSHGDSTATAALDLVTYHFQKQIGALSIALGGLDTLVLTATVMERSSDLRQRMLAGLEWFGISVDKELNQSLGRAGGIISQPDSAVKIIVIPTNEISEMKQIADTVAKEV